MIIKSRTWELINPKLFKTLRIELVLKKKRKKNATTARRKETPTRAHLHRGVYSIQENITEKTCYGRRRRANFHDMYSFRPFPRERFLRLFRGGVNAHHHTKESESTRRRPSEKQQPVKSSECPGGMAIWKFLPLASSADFHLGSVAGERRLTIESSRLLKAGLLSRRLGPAAKWSPGSSLSRSFRSTQTVKQRDSCCATRRET